MKSPLFSIIIPTYNRWHTITKAIDSALNQTFDNFEIIICDDGSTDETSRLVYERFPDPRIKYFRTEHKGVSHARNFGISKSQGEYIAFLDSDDEYLPNYLHEANEFLKKNSYPIAFLRSFSISSNSKQKIQISKNVKELLLNSTIHLPSVICHHTILRQIRFNEKYNVAEDYNLWIRILDAYPYFEIPIYSVQINQTANSLSQSGGNEKNLEYIYTIQEILNEMKQNNNKLGKWFFKINLANRFSYYINIAYSQDSFSDIINVGIPIIMNHPYVIFYKNNCRTIFASIIKYLTGTSNTQTA